MGKKQLKKLIKGMAYPSPTNAPAAPVQGGPLPVNPSASSIVAAQKNAMAAASAKKNADFFAQKERLAEIIANYAEGKIDPDDPLDIGDYLLEWGQTYGDANPLQYHARVNGTWDPDYPYDLELEHVSGSVGENDFDSNVRAPSSPVIPTTPTWNLDPNGPQTPDDMAALIAELRSKGVAEDTLADIQSGALPMDHDSRMRRAQEMGLETEVPFKRIDVPGRNVLTRLLGDKGSPGRSQNLLYSAPTYAQAREGNQTGGSARYDLMFPKGIFGLHQGVVRPDITDPLEGLVLAAADPKTNVGRNMIEGTYGGYYDKLTGSWVTDKARKGQYQKDFADAIRMMDMSDSDINESNALRREHYTKANAHWKAANIGGAHHSVDKYPWHGAGPGWSEGTPLQNTMAQAYVHDSHPVQSMALHNSLLDNPHSRDLGGDVDQAGDVEDLLHFSNVDFGGAEILKNLGYTGTVVNDETGMPAATFYPERVREKKISALDPRYRNSPNIFQSLLAPVGVAGAAGASQENR